MPTFLNEKGFTVIELLAVMAVIAILGSPATLICRLCDEKAMELR
jgi:prepilin-type N-terminal cleavage/methylation domain-containing protein